MQKLTGAASRAQLIPNADMQNEIQVSVSLPLYPSLVKILIISEIVTPAYF